MPESIATPGRSQRTPILHPSANFINGTWHVSGDGAFTAVTDKYHGTELARIPMASAAQLEEAIAAAHASRPVLRGMSAGERSAKLEALARLMEERADELARLIMQEAGKPIGHARDEVARSLTTVRTAAAEALRFGGEMAPLDFGKGAGRTAFTKRCPVGVVAAITPFNFPLNLVLHKVAPALAVGCPVLLKPARKTPLSALALGKMIEETGWPSGAFNVFICNTSLTGSLVQDERIALLSFTGSDAVGWPLKAMAGKKKVTLELGGNAAVLIDAGIDLAAAAKSVALGANLYAGQTCISTQRVFVVQPAFDRFRDLLVAAFNALQAGDLADPAVTVGPIISKDHYQRIAAWLQEAMDGGAEVLAGGTPVDEERNVFAATLLTGTRPAMKVASEEVFGPITLLEPVKDFQTGLDRVNASRYGLQAGVFTNDLSHVKRAHEALEVGAVIINDIPGFRIDSMPYGGIKDSGLGREGVRYAMEDMSEPRLLVF